VIFKNNTFKKAKRNHLMDYLKILHQSLEVDLLSQLIESDHLNRTTLYIETYKLIENYSQAIRDITKEIND